MTVNSSLLASVHSMGHIGTPIRVTIPHRKNPSHTRPHTRVGASIDLAILHSQTKLPRKRRVLPRPEIGQERIADDRLALSKVHPEDIKLLPGLVAVLAAVLQMLKGLDRPIINRDIVSCHLRPPVRVA